MFQASIRAIAGPAKETIKNSQLITTTDRADEAISAAILSNLTPQHKSFKA